MIQRIDSAWYQRAAAYQATLTMPTGALGRLLDLGQQLCAIQETLRPVTEPAAVLVLAADHGIAAEGVSAYPREVTKQMLANFQAGGAAINVLARRSGARVLAVDVGVGSAGTANFLHGPAMSREQAEQAIAVGRQIVAEKLSDVRVLALGEMGIGNTTSASALTAALTGRPAREVTGRGTGIDDAALSRKIALIEQSLGRHFGGKLPAEPLDALSAVGGFEIAGLAGAALEGASRRMVVVLDGFISSVAGLIAARLDPNVTGYLVPAHRSVEAGQRAVLAALDLNSLFDLGLRLGEGTGAALAFHFIHAAADILRDMATFASAGVADR